MSPEKLIPEKRLYEDYMGVRAECLLKAVLDFMDDYKADWIASAASGKKGELSEELLEYIVKNLQIHTSKADIFQLS